MDLTLPSFIQEKIKHPGFQKYFRNTGWLFFGKIFGLIISFFVGAYVARYLGPSNYGILNYVISFVGLFSFVASFGIDGILVNELVKYPEKNNKLLGTSFFIKLIGGMVVVILAGLFSVILRAETMLRIFILAYSFTYIFQSFNIIDSFFQAIVSSKNTVIVQTISNIILSVAKMVLIFYKAQLLYFVLIFLLESIILGIGYIYVYLYKKGTILSWKFDFGMLKHMISLSWPLMISGGFYVIYSRIDQVMIKQMLSDTSVGIYSAAVRLSELWIFIPLLITSSLWPSIIKAKISDGNKYESRLGNLYFIIFYISIFISLFISLFSKFLLNMIFGNQYILADTSLKIYVWAGIGTSMAFVLSQYLILIKKTRITFFITFFGMLINVILNIILIPKVGIEGAALATLVSYFSVVFSIVIFKDTRKHLLFILKSLNIPNFIAQYYDNK